MTSSEELPMFPVSTQPRRPRRKPTRVFGAAVAVFVSVGILALTGCVSNSNSSASGKLPAGTDALVGRYAHFDVVAYQDSSMKTLIITTGFSDLAIHNGQLWNQMTFCHADTPTDQNIEVSISDAATRAITPFATPVEVTKVDGKFRIQRPQTPTGIGIALLDPTNDKLPTDPNDPRITDADGDGNPGVTSKVKVSDALEGEIYIARREIFAYTLTQQSEDRLTGFVTDNSEQLVLGASNPVFLASAQWQQIDDTSRNPVIWQRVDPSMDCDSLAAVRATLFPPNPTIDW
jgi:hypothetical protein